MIIGCCFIPTLLCNRTVAALGVVSLHTGLQRSSMFKIVIKKQKPVGRKKILVWKGMQIQDLVKSMNMNGKDVLDALNRVMQTEQKLSFSMEIHDMSLLSNVAKLCGASIEEKKIKKEAETIDRDVYCRNVFADPERLRTRPPVVTIMGHVDHGKTTLLDSLRSSRIVDTEFGGITQHIGAFKVRLADVSGKVGPERANDVVTFLDTPGHAAFSSMRARGARCTDIVVLVVAIDDGLMPQTLESIRFAKEAKVPMIVVVNKLDRICTSIEELDSPAARRRLDLVHQSLSKHSVVVEAYGGEVQCIPISALKNWNLDLLQEAVLALAEVIDVRSDFQGPCEGVVLEAKTVDNLGKVATVLVQQGSLRPGAVVVAGHSFARVRAMRADSGAAVTEAQPGDPVEVAGWKEELPQAGDTVIEVESESRAKEVLAHRRASKGRERTVRDHEQYERSMEAYNASYKAYVSEGFKKGFRLRKERPLLADFLTGVATVDGVEVPQVNVVVKADVQGSCEAIRDVLLTAAASCAGQCVLKVAHIGVGPLVEGDVELAACTGALLYLFNLPQSLSMARALQVEVRHFNVIYHLFDDLRDHVTAKLPQHSHCEVVGEAEVLQMFDIREKKVVVPVIGCKCSSGTLYRSKDQYHYRLMRPSPTSSQEPGTLDLVQEGLLCKSLRHLRNDVDSVRRGVECGLVLLDKSGEPFTVNPGDILQCCQTVYLKQTLKWNLGFQ